MPRPRHRRRVRGLPPAAVFKPAGTPAAQLEELTLAVTEFEALRLADWEGRYHAEAAGEMGVSRQTFGRMIESARRKVAEALVFGKALRIEGGSYVLAGPEARRFACAACGHAWEAPFGAPRPEACPACGAPDLRRVDGGAGRGGGGGRGRGRHGHRGGRGRGGPPA